MQRNNRFGDGDGDANAYSIEAHNIICDGTRTMQCILDSKQNMYENHFTFQFFFLSVGRSFVRSLCVSFDGFCSIL